MAMIKVGMADLNVCKSPDALTTLGLGSCIGIILYDQRTKVSGLAHIMLPDSTQIKKNENKAKFADTAIYELIKEMEKIGAHKSRLVSKIAGGAQMFSFSGNNDMMRIGVRNDEATRKLLKELGIPLLAEECGKNYGRTIEFYSETGELHIKTIGKEIKII
jgi:chemotaxis protein CheD